MWWIWYTYMYLFIPYRLTWTIRGTGWVCDVISGPWWLPLSPESIVTSYLLHFPPPEATWSIADSPFTTLSLIGICEPTVNVSPESVSSYPSTLASFASNSCTMSLWVRGSCTALGEDELKSGSSSSLSTCQRSYIHKRIAITYSTL